jgi:DMSO/TMAO reductase YedYZ molybdopterin-dependent catalytic subunit
LSKNLDKLNPTPSYPEAAEGARRACRAGAWICPARWDSGSREVSGQVETPLSLSLADLRALPRQEQTSLHHCIQGWTSIGRWGGVPLREILDRCRPLPEAKHLVFHSFGMHEKSGKPYYECIDLAIGHQPQALLAYDFNGEPLPVPHGAPLRVRFETKLGFKMVKFVRAIEVVGDYRQVGDGMGGVREDKQQFDMGAGI